MSGLFWFSILCLVHNGRGSCTGDYVVFCDSVNDLLSKTESETMKMVELQIGTQRDNSRSALQEKVLTRLKQCPRLKKLTIINQFNGIVPSHSPSLNSLTSLVLVGNVLPTTSVSHFSLDKHLELLCLQNNSISKMVGVLRNQKMDIAVFDLSYNKLTTMKGHEFTNIDVVQLILSHNRLTNISGPHGLPRHVQHLHLDYNDFKSFNDIFWSERELEELKELTLSHNKLESLKYLPNFPSLRLLDLSFNRILSVSLVPHFSKKLRYLNLKGNKLVKFGSDHQVLFNRSGSEFYIDLSFNAFTYLDLGLFEDVTVYLNIRGNPWNCQCIQDIEDSILRSVENPDHKIQRTECDVQDYDSGKIPYCMVYNTFTEPCFDDHHVSDRELEGFRNLLTKAMFDSLCDFENNYNIREKIRGLLKQNN